MSKLNTPVNKSYAVYVASIDYYYYITICGRNDLRLDTYSIYDEKRKAVQQAKRLAKAFNIKYGGVLNDK